MKINKSIVVLFGLFLYSLNVKSAELVNTKITKLMMDNKYAHQVYIETSTQRSTGVPECFSSNWSFVLRVDTEMSKSMYSSLLAAYMAGKSVTLIGNDQCNHHSGIEDLRRIELL